MVPGDTLLAIAAQYLPSGRLVDEFANEIASINGITDPTQIAVGDVLTIPQ
ncbi:MAG: LysM peptidoglycan-binding domain-containing protein [Dehalococcoidia bacterium]|nr:LysM peptidoglycan-binding domain-containing protein [Dehalococcoidia bacterium]